MNRLAIILTVVAVASGTNMKDICWSAKQLNDCAIKHNCIPKPKITVDCIKKCPFWNHCKYVDHEAMVYGAQCELEALQECQWVCLGDTLKVSEPAIPYDNMQNCVKDKCRSTMVTVYFASSDGVAYLCRMAKIAADCEIKYNCTSPELTGSRFSSQEKRECFRRCQFWDDDCKYAGTKSVIQEMKDYRMCRRACFHKYLNGNRLPYALCIDGACEDEFISLVMLVLGLALLLCVGHASAQCPSIGSPCTCSQAMYEPVSINCDRASSLQQVTQAIAAARNTRIDRLVISNTPISTLPARAFEGLQVVSLVLKRNNLRSIDDAAFDGGQLLDTLKEVSFEQNQLGQVPQTGITRLRGLKKLILRSNRISLLPPRAFQNYESRTILEKLDLSQNDISGIGTVSLEGLTSLKEISFEKNLFTAIPAQGLRVLRSSLEDLNLGINKIADVPVNALDFPVLKSLSLEFNTISAITPDAFRALPNLLYLYVGGNKFPSYDPNMFRYLQQLRILGIGEMGITEIPANAFQNTPSLQRLEMSGATVANVQPGAFQVIANAIEVIVLNENRLQRIRTDMFQGLTRLKSLDLQGNQLSVVDDGSFSNLPALRHLDISNNKLQVVASRTFLNTFQPTVQDSRVLYVCDNPWVCDERLDWFRQWLRQDRAIIIDKPPSCLAECFAPEWLSHWPLREPDPVTSPPFTQAPQRAVVSRIGWIILAIILTILLTSICLLGLVRYFVGRRRRRDKEKSEEERILRSSVVSGYRGVGMATTGAGSIYPGSVVDLPPAHHLDVDSPPPPVNGGYLTGY